VSRYAAPQLLAMPRRTPRALRSVNIASTPGMSAARPADKAFVSSSTQRSNTTFRAAGVRSANSMSKPCASGRPTRLIHSADDGIARSNPSSWKAVRAPIRAASTQKRSVATRVPSRSNTTASNRRGKSFMRALRVRVASASLKKGTLRADFAD
jgi:hypothetical protein